MIFPGLIMTGGVFEKQMQECIDIASAGTL